MAQYNAQSRQNAFNSYMASGSHNYSPTPSRPTFPPPVQPRRYSAPAIPNNQASWSQHWQGYRPPAYSYTPPAVVDRRTAQQILIDEARGGSTAAMWNLAHNYLEGKNGFGRNESSGIFWLKTAFEHGEAEAAARLFYYFDPDFYAGESSIKKDAIQSLYWLQKAAKAGEVEAMAILGDRTLLGAGVDQDLIEGLRLLKAAHAAGDKFAARRLVFAYQWGWGVKKDLNEAIKWQRVFAKSGFSSDGKVELIRLLIEADDPAHRANTAEIEAVIASDADNVETQLLHAKLADNGELGAPDPMKCVTLCQKIIARNQAWGRGPFSVSRAQYLLADHLYEGRGIRKNEAAAYDLYRAAAVVTSTAEPPSARNNFYFAALLSGRLQISHADGSTTIIDEPKAALPMLFLAEQSGDLPKPLRAQAALLAAHHLAKHPELAGASLNETTVGQLVSARENDPDTTLGIAFGLRSGWFGAPDQLRYRELVKGVADSGDEQAAYWLARWNCEDSEGKDPNWQADLEALVKNKHSDACLWMFDLLLSGKYLSKDLPRAEALIRTAAIKDNNREAQNALGLALWRGTLEVKNVPEGLGLLEQSLQNGMWLAGRNLAKIYHLGLDVEKDETRARAFLEKAGEIGDRSAVQVVVAAYEKGDIIDADAKAADRWRAKLEN